MGSQIQRKFSLLKAPSISTSKDGEPTEKSGFSLKREKSNGERSPRSPSDENQSSSGFLKFVKESIEVAKKDLPFVLDPHMISALLDAKLNTNDIDDRKMLLEHGLILLANTPPETEMYQKMQGAVVQLLYNDLSHPPPTYLTTKYAWRTADGSCNNVHIPEMGKAGNPYSRSVQQVHPLPRHMLPDAGLVFDTLLKREKFVEHPAGLSSLMFSFAALVIHSCFRTSHTQWEVNETSSYVDLSPLYGNDQKGQDSVRNKKSGRGLLHPDVFFEDRLLLLPPAVCVLLVLFNRNHNYIAGKLLDINERGTWKDPSLFPASDPPEKLEQQDEELFQTARLINCAWFANVVFSDYFAAILGLTRTGSSWYLNPFEQIRKDDHSIAERGMGNSVSVEFNCLYRWHATTSQRDEKWIQTVFKQFFEGKNPEEVTPMDFAKEAVRAQEMMPDIEHWTFGGLKRGEDGRFRDEDLAKALMDATNEPAAKFGARGTPGIMKLNEVMGIEQARRWGCCSLNDFRKFLGLKPYANFYEWNPDQEIAEAASKLYYGDVNNLELYVGLQAEEVKPVMPGAGLCPGYTVSRAILADAIALTRGDRFYNTDMTPHNYTSWGLNDCTRPTTNPGFGSMLGRLFLRTLPREYTSDSSYTWFPLMTPKAMKGYCGAMGKDMEDKYVFERPTRAREVKVVSEYEDAKKVLEDRETFRPPYADRVGAMEKGQGLFIEYELTDAGLATQRALSSHFPPSSSIIQSLQTHLTQILDRDSYFLSGKKTKFVDVNAVLRALPVRWMCEEVVGIPLKDRDGKGNGQWTDEEMWRMCAEVYEFVFLDEDPSRQMENESRARANAESLFKAIKSSLRSAHGGGIKGKIGSFFNGHHANGNGDAKKRCHEFLNKAIETGKPVDELTDALLSVMVMLVVELSQSMTNLVNMYLDSPLRAEIPGASPEKLDAFTKESMRLEPIFAGVFREARKDTVIGSKTYKTNDRLFLYIAKANRDAPSTNEPLSSLSHSAAFDPAFVPNLTSSVLPTLFSLDKLRRAPGMSGVLKRFKVRREEGMSRLADITDGSAGMGGNGNGGMGVEYVYMDRGMKEVPWATEMILQYDV